MATEGMNKIDGYFPPGRGAVDRLLTAADKARANTQAIHDIRKLHHPVDCTDQGCTGRRCTCGYHYPCPTIEIIERHGL